MRPCVHHVSRLSTRSGVRYHEPSNAISIAVCGNETWGRAPSLNFQRHQEFRRFVATWLRCRNLSPLNDGEP